MRSAAWARSRRRWRKPHAREASKFALQVPVKEVLVEKGRAAGVVTENGDIFRAKIVAANVNPKLLYRDLVPQEAQPADFRERIARFRCGSGTFRMNVALSELPDFSALPGRDAGRASHRRHHHRAVARLYGRRLFRCAALRLVAKADRRNAHSFDARRDACAQRRACGESLLPACRAGSARWQIVGRSSRRGRRSHDRDGRSSMRRISGRQ